MLRMYKKKFKWKDKVVSVLNIIICMYQQCNIHWETYGFIYIKSSHLFPEKNQIQKPCCVKWVYTVSP